MHAYDFVNTRLSIQQTCWNRPHSSYVTWSILDAVAFPIQVVGGRESL